MDLVTVYDEDYAEVSCVNNFKAKKKKSALVWVILKVY